MLHSYISGKLLKEKRKEEGLTQKEVAKATDLSQAHIAKIENEKVDPRLSTVHKILKVLSEDRGDLTKIMTKNVISVSPDSKIKEVSNLMRKHDISQLPVIDKGKLIGSICEADIIKNLEKGIGERKVKEIMKDPFPTIRPKEKIGAVKMLLNHNPAVIVKNKEGILGIISKSDLLKIC